VAKKVMIPENLVSGPYSAHTGTPESEPLSGAIGSPECTETLKEMGILRQPEAKVNGEAKPPRKPPVRRPIGSGLQLCAKIERMMGELDAKQRGIVVDWFCREYGNHDDALADKINEDLRKRLLGQ